MKNKLMKIVGVSGSAAGVLGATSAFATGGVDDLFAAANVSTLATNITTLLLAGVGITVLFVGYKFLKRGLGRM